MSIHPRGTFGGNIGCRDKSSSWYQMGFPMLIAQLQQLLVLFVVVSHIQKRKDKAQYFYKLNQLFYDFEIKTFCITVID